MQPQVETATARNSAQAPNGARRQGGRGWSYTLTSWLGLVPFLLFCLLFEILPAIIIIQGSFSDDNTGKPTLDNYKHMFSQVSNLHAFANSISLSLVTALLGGIIGGLAAYGVFNLRTGSLRNFLVGFSSIAANFAGVPLAFAFVATLGVTGFITVAIHNVFHVNLYDIGFSLYSFWGLVIVYTYFQLPLMILLTLPALSALRPEWREAATNLGASRASHLASLAHCSHNVTICQLIRSFCHRICTRSRRHQHSTYPDQFCCKWQCHHRLWAGQCTGRGYDRNLARSGLFLHCNASPR